MGGYGSGRTPRHQTTYSYLPIDTTELRKQGLLADSSAGGRLGYTLIWKNAKEEITKEKHSLSFRVEHYDAGGEFSRWGAIGHVTIGYSAARDGRQPFTLPLLTTQPNYGGLRYWFLSPCCGKRCRVLYLPAKLDYPAMIPTCRVCLDLHYASQQQSYIERHKTYERYLLMNYGYAWAQIEYGRLKEHYFTVTPEWEYIKLSSILTRELEILEHLIHANRVMLKTNAANLRSLISVEDRLVFLDHYLKTQGKAYVLELVRMAKMEGQIKQDIAGLAPGEFERIISGEPAPEEKTPIAESISIQALMERKKIVQEQLQQLKPAA